MRTTLPGILFSTLITLGFAGTAHASHQQGPYSVEVLINGVPQPVFMSGGQAFVAGAYGAAYQVRVHNQSGRRIEAVIAVDGRDVVTGQPVNPRRHRGHLVSPWSTTTIDGFRSSSTSVATFRFSTIGRSYAWRTGTIWGIGTIRVWAFEEAAEMPVPHLVVPDGATRSRSRHGGGMSQSEAGPSAPRDMGTEYGEQRWSAVSRTRFIRQSHRASAVFGIRYQSRQALAAAGILQPVLQQPVYYPSPEPYWWDGPYTYAPPPVGYPY